MTKISNHVRALVSTLLLVFISDVADAESLVLGGPEPHGWTTSSDSDVAKEANVAISLGLLYEEGNIDAKEAIYREGSDDVDSVILETFGTEANNPENSRYDPTYSIHLDAFDLIGEEYENDVPGNFDDKPEEEYAHALAEDLFAIDLADELGRGIDKDAINIYGIWMRIHSYLYQIVQECNRSPSDASKMILLLDQAVALWIGRLQIYGSNNRGTMMYNLVERAGVHFSQDSGETMINTKFMNAVKDLKVIIDTCSGSDGYKNMYQKFHSISATMRVPLMQNLIHHVSSNDSVFAEMYALSLLPHIRSCDPTEFHFLIDKLVVNNLEDDTLGVVLPRLQKMYSCLGISCNDVGAYSGDRVPFCNDESVYPTYFEHFGMYHVRKYMRADWDINHIDILLRRGNVDGAKEVYSMGYHIVDTDIISLQDMSKHDDIPVIEDASNRLYSMFEDFYGGSKIYADDLVMEAFNNSEASEFIVPRILQTIVGPHYALRSFFASYEACINHPNRTASESFWDRGIAVLIGSMNPNFQEKEKSPPRNWFALTKEFCPHFGCNAEVNIQMNELLNDGKELISRGGHCEELRDDIIDIESLMLTPIVQGLLWNSAMREEDTSSKTYYGDAWAFAKALLPTLNVEDPSYSGVIEENLINDFTEFEDAEKVFWVVGRAIDQLGVECENIGTIDVNITSGMSFCDFMSVAPDATSRPSITGAVPDPTSTPTLAPTKDNEIINVHLINGYTFSSTAAEEKGRLALEMKEILGLQNGAEHINATLETYTNSSMKEWNMNAPNNMANDPYYNFYRYALRDDDLFTNFMNGNHSEVDTYADAIVETAITMVAESEFTFEALLVTTVWMQVVHTLTSAVDGCKESMPTSAMNKIDEALALYVGEDQSKAKSDGYLFYSFAQRAASIFKNTAHNNEAISNQDIIALFKEAKDEAINCDSEENFRNFRSTVGKIISKMNIPLLQMLFHYVKKAKRENHGDFVTLYALSVLPQAATCSPKVYHTLSDVLIDHVYTGDDTDKIIDMIEDSYHCFGVTCQDIHGLHSHCTEKDYLPFYAGFYSLEDVDQYGRLDEDILKMKALILEGASSMAMEYYSYGSFMFIHNPNESHETLETIAKETFQNRWSYLQTINSYHDSDDNYGHIKVTNILEDGGINSQDKAEMVLRALQTMILFPYGIGSMYDIVEDVCSNSTIPVETKHRMRRWNRGVAILIGSIEGVFKGGDPMNNGVSMYALAKETCHNLDTCTASGDAESNKELLNNYNDGLRELTHHTPDCVELKSLIQTKIEPRLLVPIIQGILMNSVSTNDPTANILAESIIPIMNEKNSSIANTIEINTQLNEVGNYHDVFNALSSIVDDIAVDCKEIGVVPRFNKSLCGDIFDAEVGTSLLGIYETITNVEDRADIATDVQEMLQDLESGDRDRAKNIYSEGLNSRIYDPITKKRPRFSIQMMSTEIGTNEPIYNLYMYTFKDNDGKFLDNDVSQYADSLVMSFFDEDGIFDGAAKSLPVEAAIALNIWSHVIHELHETLQKCQSNEIFDTDGVRSLDEAVAYWIGSGSEDSTGHLLYHLTQEIGKYFGEDGVVRANKNIITSFKNAAMKLNTDGACSAEDPDTIKSLRTIFNDLIGQMTVPLIQSLIHNLVEENQRQRVNIYAHAVVPLLASCQSDTFGYLKDKLILSSYARSDVGDIISKIQSTYSCLGLRCKDIGIYYKSDVPECIDPPEFGFLGGYKPAYDIRDVSKIDIDIRYIEIMMEMKAYEAAQDVYEHGKHSLVKNGDKKELSSLKSLAISEGRNVIPNFKLFKEYFSDNYADETLTEIFMILSEEATSGEHNEHFFKASAGQSQELVVKLLQYHVIPMASLQRMYESELECSQSSTFDSSKRKWQEAAGLLIGSMEGPSRIGSGAGYMMFNLAQSLCLRFGKCEGGISSIKNKLEVFLYAGSFAVTSQSCDNIAEIASNIEMNLLVTLIQATLVYSVKNSALEIESPSSDLASGYIFSDAVTPYINDVDKEAAIVIQENMEFQFGVKPVGDGYRRVFQEFRDTIQLMDIDCMDVGYYAEVSMGVCPDVKGDPGTSSSGTSSSNGAHVMYKILNGLLVLIIVSLIGY